MQEMLSHRMICLNHCFKHSLREHFSDFLSNKIGIFVCLGKHIDQQ